MESNVTIIVYAVLLALLGIVYWMVNRKDVLGKKSQPRPVSGFFSKFGRTLPSHQDDTSVDASDQWVQVASVLEDMYREFAHKIGELEGRFDQLESDIHQAIRTSEAIERDFESLRGELSALTHAEPLAPSLSSASDAGTVSHVVQNPFDARYLEVLDRLQRGQEPEVIAGEMQISLSEVHQVLAIMMISPNEGSVGPAVD